MLDIRHEHAIRGVIEDAVRNGLARLQEAGSPDSVATQGIFTQVAEVAYGALSRLAQGVNMLPPINRIPLELVVRIFSELDLKERVLASQVCQQWRAKALSCPTLWNRLSFKKKPGKELIELLNRTQNAPVHLELTWQTLAPNDWEDIVDALQAHLHHMKTLILSMKLRRHVAAISTHTLCMTLCYPAPLLEVLGVHMARMPPLPHSTACTLPADFLGRCAPRLRQINLQGIRLPDASLHGSLQFASVERLTYVSLMPEGASVEADFQSISAVFPYLKHLSFSIQYAQGVLSHHGPPLLPSLQSVQLKGRTDDHTLANTLAILNPSRLRLITVMPYGSAFPLLTDAHGAGPPTELQLSLLDVRWMNTGGHALLRDAAGRAHEIGNIYAPLVGTLFSTPPVFAGLRRLVIAESMWPEGVVLSLMQLEELRVLLTTVAEWRRHSGWLRQSAGVFQMNYDAGPWVLPALHTLGFAAGSRVAHRIPDDDDGPLGLLVSCAQIIRFLDEAIRPATLPLPRLCLFGVELLEITTAFALPDTSLYTHLMTRVETVVLNPGVPCLVQPVTEPQSSWWPPPFAL